MKGWLLDANVVSEPGRRRPSERVLSWLASIPNSQRFISVLSVAELEQGTEALAPDHAARPRLIRFRQQVEAEHKGRILPLSDDVVRLWGQLRGRRMAAGLGPTGVVGSLLAATAVHRGLYLATRNGSVVIGLGTIVFDPWTDDPAEFPVWR